MNLIDHKHTCHFLADGSHRGILSVMNQLQGHGAYKERDTRIFKNVFCARNALTGPCTPSCLFAFLWHIYVLTGSDPETSSEGAAPSRKVGQFEAAEVFHL